MRNVYLTAILTLLTISGFSQTKTVVGIMPFKSASSNESSNYYNRGKQNQGANIIAIQDAVAEAFLSAKRFTLVEREKMEQIKGEKKMQQSADYIDGTVVEQSKSMGASYIVTGNVSDAEFEEKQNNYSYFNVTSRNAKISFSIRVIDVTTGEIMASEKFSAESKGKGAFDEALKIIKPNIEKFIKDNFKITVSIASIESKNSANEATKVLISGGTAIGLKPNTTLKVFELTSLMVDGKKIPRKKEIGKIVVEKVEDENFSVCTVSTGGADIATKSEAGANLKCEIISE
ncbi:CsgG/HfaB family protein [Flavobacterium psychrophilum]|uniref:CsgG/HfaB family protein n=1 Tax=Flavobacterium psychrophilum TaxID=96345 RepID=UPI001D06B8CA|nr:CsgG/HfaB family protein [Flavobacterium psychrophilum]MCB6062631.1 CsgG/HfaB family protein [Flavobacterium psychrophilum]MCB6089351.1 CsgG/HfaB family protein [Flavobacterium psychrophilum]